MWDKALLGGVAPPNDAPTRDKFSGGGVAHGITVVAVGDVGVIPKEGEAIAILHTNIVLFGCSPQEEITSVGAVGLCVPTKREGIGRHGGIGIMHCTAHTGKRQGQPNEAGGRRRSPPSSTHQPTCFLLISDRRLLVRAHGCGAERWSRVDRWIDAIPLFSLVFMTGLN